MEQHHDSLKQLAPPKTYQSTFAKSYALAHPPSAGTPWLKVLDQYLQSKAGAALDLGSLDPLEVHQAPVEMLSAFTNFARTHQREVRAIRFPLATLCVPAWLGQEWATVDSVAFLPVYMGREMDLRHLPRLKALRIGEPVNLKRIFMPKGCELIRAERDGVALAKLSESSDLRGEIQRGFLTIVECDEKGAACRVRRSRLSSAYWQRTTSSLQSWTENLNALDSSEGRCEEMAALWVKDRFDYQSNKQSLAPTTAPDDPPQKSIFEYKNFQSLASLLQADEELGLHSLYQEMRATSPAHHFVRRSGWTHFLRSEFGRLMQTKAGDRSFSLYLVEKADHVMALELLVLKGANGAFMYVLAFYEPNRSKSHIKKLAHAIPEVDHWTMQELSPSFGDCRAALPSEGTDPTVAFLRYEPPPEMSDAEHSRESSEAEVELQKDQVLRFWPDPAPKTIDSMGQLELIELGHLTDWKALVPPSLEGLTAHEQIQYLAAPRIEQEGGFVKSMMPAILMDADPLDAMLDVLEKHRKSAVEVVDALIAVVASEPAKFSDEQLGILQGILSSAIRKLASRPEGSMSGEAIVKLLSPSPQATGGTEIAVRRFITSNIPRWLREVEDLFDAGVVTQGQVRTIVESLRPAAPGAWNTLLQGGQAHPKFIQSFFLGLAVLNLGLSESGELSDLPGPAVKSARWAEATQRAWRFFRTHTPNDLDAIRALLVSASFTDAKDPREAIFDWLTTKPAAVDLLIDAMAEVHDAGARAPKPNEMLTLWIELRDGYGTPPRRLFNRLVELSSPAPEDGSLPIATHVAKGLLRLEAKYGWPKQALPKLCTAHIDETTPDDPALAKLLLDPLGLKWTPGKGVSPSAHHA